MRLAALAVLRRAQDDLKRKLAELCGRSIRRQTTSADEKTLALRQLFTEREFLAYFIARQSALLAFSIEDVAVSWQIFDLRHKPFDLGLVGLVVFIPQVLLAVPAGVLADRHDRRRVVMLAAIAEAIGLCGFLALVLLHVRSLGIYLSAVAFIGIAHAAGTPAQRAMLANLVRAHHFVRAQALASTAGQLIVIAGPALAGGLIALGTPFAFGASVLTYVAAMIAFAQLGARDAADVNESPLMKTAAEGIRFIFSRKVILGAISLDLFAVLFGGATALLPVFATDILRVGPTGFGLLRAAPAVGAAIVAFTISRRPIDRHAGPLLLACVAGFGAFTIVFGLSTNFGISLVALALTGGFDMVSVVIRAALVQLGTPNAMRGRVGAVENVFIGASNELGAFESGTLAAFIGTRASVVAGGLGTLAVIALWTFIFPELRGYDRLTAND